MSESSIIRVSKRDGARIDFIAQRKGVKRSSAKVTVQRDYDRLIQKGWARLDGDMVTLTPEGFRAHMSAKVQGLRNRK